MKALQANGKAGSIGYAVYNGRQLALKMNSNSMYGAILMIKGTAGTTNREDLSARRQAAEIRAADAIHMIKLAYGEKIEQLVQKANDLNVFLG